MAQHPGWYVQSADGFLVFARRGTVPAADRPKLWRDAIELHRALLAPVSHAATPIPAAPGMDLGRQRSCRTGRFAGGLAGAVIGFIGSCIGCFAVMFSRVGPHVAGLRPPAMTSLIPAFFLIVPCGLVVGAIAGSWLGARVADLHYRPNPGGTSALKISKGWVVAGAFLGWVVGLAIGMGLTMVVMRQMRFKWLIPILFFSPALLCLVLGGFAGFDFARKRAARRTGE